MKHALALVLLTTLAGCGMTSGVKDTPTKLSSKTTKNVAAYVTCAQEKWTALTADVKASSKDNEGTVEARDSKTDARERLDVTADGGGAHVVMHEMQTSKDGYDSRYREAAIACL
jgi:hypothetical protein